MSLQTKVVILLCLALASCAEHTRIHSYPGGARVYLDGELVGKTPLYRSVARGDIAPIQYKIEKEYYQPAEGTLATPLSRGRVAASIFTLGIFYLFKSPYYVESVSLELVPLPEHSTRASDGRERLEQLESLRSQGLVSEEEYERLRRTILESL